MSKLLTITDEEKQKIREQHKTETDRLKKNDDDMKKGLQKPEVKKPS